MKTNTKETEDKVACDQLQLPNASTMCSSTGMCSSRSNMCGQADNLPPINIYENFFQMFKFPLFIIELNPNCTVPKLNSTASTLVKSCNANFYGNSYLEKFDGTLKNFISSMKQRSDNFYSDIVHIPLVRGSKIIYELFASFDSETKLLGILLLEASKSVKEQVKVLENFKCSLSTSLSHELNNPINSLIPLLEILPSCIRGEKSEDVKEVALSNAILLKNKIKDLIDYTNMGTKNLKLRATQFYLDDLFEELKKLFRLEIAGNLNTFVVKILTYSDKRLVIFTDRERLKQVLIKLISNANKFTNKGTISLIAKEVKENFNVRFIVKDTGIGISKDKLELLFAPLIQKTVNQNEIGSLPGLGLEIAKGLCKFMESKLTVTSEEGKGTCFTFEIPVCHISLIDSRPIVEPRPVTEPLTKKEASFRGSFQ